jgi:hypothetical protein
VVELKDIPPVRDRAVASRLPELAMLSVMAHPELEIAEVAVEAISQLPGDRRQLYLDVILMTLPEAIRRILEAHPARPGTQRPQGARRAGPRARPMSAGPAL